MPTRKEIEALQEKLRRQLREVEKLSNPGELESQRKRMARKRAEARGIDIPACEDPERRARLEADPIAWIEFYIVSRFARPRPFNDDERQIMLEILHRAKVGGDKAIAEERGGGKSTRLRAVILYAMLTGLLHFPVLFGATKDAALGNLVEIKAQLEFNELLAADYPEVCAPIRALEGSPARANLQTNAADGKPTRMKWADNMIVLPTVFINGKQSVSSGAILMVRGLDSAVRGLHWLGQRPDFALIDDPDDPDTVNNVDLVDRLEKRIDTDVMGLAGQRSTITRVMLCTVQNRICVAYRFTDPMVKPWAGVRYKAIKQLPQGKAAELLEEYVELKKEDDRAGDPTGRRAMRFYLEHQTEIEADVEVSNPLNFIDQLVADGAGRDEPLEVSAVQHYYNIVARTSWAAFLSEYQQDPPEEIGPQESGITAELVAGRVNGWPQRMCPSNLVALTAACDIGWHWIHWARVAWLDGAAGLVVDYGVAEVNTTARDPIHTVERKVIAALHDLRTAWDASPVHDQTGECKTLGLCPIDTSDGNLKNALYQFIREVGGTPFIAAKGGGNYRKPQASSEPGKQRIVGDGWDIHHQPADGIWLYNLHADHWKHFCHQRWLTPCLDEARQIRPGSLSLYEPLSQSPREHHSFSKHICAEVWTTDFKEGKQGTKAYWHVKSPNNHWLDVCYMNCAAADILGVKLIMPRSVQQEPPQKTRQTPSGSRLRMPDGRPYLITER